MQTENVGKTLKTMEELRDGKCLIVATRSGITARFNAHYDRGLEVVFCVMPDTYRIIGYEQ
ncbi:hypothetical protein [Planococcus lenghuensis]|uniref:Uncharacterized protein n=1 Tax=Planococcus lenghuensis TaxID=2213202 RepID=A0A1Q2L4K2_9BACL|nr:hypothetical protein [Planococcus lenghuensis]AQQ55369.1 hypothetical protein B0X71_19555 [Planococcus lenghuensis]